MSFWVVKYDVLSLGKEASYENLDVASPFFIRPSYGDYETAAKIAEGMNKSNGGETVELVLANDKKYKGQRYIFQIAEDNSPPDEVENGEERVCPASEQ